MRLLPKREVESLRRKEDEDNVVRSVRLSQVFEREKKALDEFRQKKSEMVKRAESELKAALEVMSQERSRVETELHYAKERRDAIMPTLESLKNSLECARSIVEKERESNLAEDARLEAVSNRLKKESNRLKKLRKDLSDQSTRVAEEMEDARKRIDEARLLERNNESISIRLSKKETKLLRDVERDRKLMAAQVKELSVRNQLLNRWEADLNIEKKRIEHSQKTLMIAREQFMKEKTHYGGKHQV